MKSFTILIVLVIVIPNCCYFTVTEFAVGERTNLKHESILTPTIDDGVLLQSFYWQTPDNGKWWNMLNEHIVEFKEAGFNALWVPPMSKTDAGDISSCGYEPYDYYDLGEFNQQGRIRTRYGTRTELEGLINNAKLNDLEIIADIVINHNVGGDFEYNPFLGKDTATDFENIASEKFPRNYTHFYPCEYGTEDNMAFANFPDLCHKHPYVHDELIKWGKWLHDEIGFSGWRFDVAAGIDPEMLRDWMYEVGNWGVAEYWYGNYENLIDYLDATNNSISAFDFFLMYQLRWMAIGNGNYDMRNLRKEGLIWDNREDQAVTFVVNHDTERDQNVNIDKNRELAYAFILMHEGFPSIFWKDFFDLELQRQIKFLMNARNNYAKGETTVLFTDHDLYVIQRDGNPGIVFGLNDDPYNWNEAYITTKWLDTQLYDLTGQIENVTTDSTGKVLIQVPPTSYILLSSLETIHPSPMTYIKEQQMNTTSIDYGKISIDGKLDYDWKNYILKDKLNDAGLNQHDLNNLYLKHDNNNLYIGFGTGKTLWTEDSTHYGIAIDVRQGGARDDPWIHQNVKWAGTRTPDYIYYLKTDTSNDSWREVNNGKKFDFDTELGWNTGTIIDSNDYSSSSILGFVELKIPLTDIGFTAGGNISIMIFSTREEKLGAIDSIPQDSYTDGFGNIDSWLTLPEPLNLIVQIDEISSDTTPSKGSFSFFIFIIGMFLFSCMRSRRRRKI